MLRNDGCLMPSFIEADAYSIETYIIQYASSLTETTFLLDRNMYSQAVALAKGKRVDENTRSAAALMAFASCANTQVEPNLALYEGSAYKAGLRWKLDLQILYRADNIHPANWAALALGYAEKFDRIIPAKRTQRDDGKLFDPRGRLKLYDFVYPITLKMALVLRSGGSPDKKMMELLDWTYKFWHFSAPAIMLATQALSHKPPGKVFKGIGSRDRRKALAGVKNAAWDLVYISVWYEKMKQQSEINDLTVLCSRDKVLLRVADLLRESVLGNSEPVFFTANFGNSVLERHNSYMLDLSNTERALKPLPTDFQGYRAKLVCDLEADILR